MAEKDIVIVGEPDTALSRARREQLRQLAEGCIAREERLIMSPQQDRLDDFDRIARDVLRRSFDRGDGPADDDQVGAVAAAFRAHFATLDSSLDRFDRWLQASIDEGCTERAAVLAEFRHYRSRHDARTCATCRHFRHEPNLCLSTPDGGELGVCSNTTVLKFTEPDEYNTVFWPRRDFSCSLWEPRVTSS